MAGPKETVWHAEPHTLAKHLILGHYLAAWFPILGRWNRRIVYYDGFAGPGRYSQGEAGSPIIALTFAKEHSAAFKSELVFTFVERDSRRAAHLEAEIEKLGLPRNFKYTVLCDEFESALRRSLDDLEREGLQLAPTFAFIDPFGLKGLEFELVARLLRQQSCEVLITFMNQAIERWATELPAQIETLVGRRGAAELIARSSDRIGTARELYARSLRTAASFVRFFEMRDAGHRPIYDLFFASNNDLGHYKMKEAMWKADETGEYSFSDGVDPAQATLFSPDAARDFAPSLWEHFQGQTVYWEQIQKHTRDHTAFLEKHARGALKLLERDGGVAGRTVRVAEKRADGTPRRKNTFPDGTRVTFFESR